MRLREQFFLTSLLGVVLLILPAHAAWAADADLDGKVGALDRAREERSTIFTKFGVQIGRAHV